MLIALLGQLAESLCLRPPAVTTRCHPGLFQGNVMATETRGHSWCFISVGHATAVTRPVSCGAIGLTDVNSVESTEGWLQCKINFFFFFLPVHFLSVPAPSLLYIPASLLGEEAHHRPVWGPERWTQPDFLAGSPLWSHPGKGFLSLTHTFISYLTALFSITHTLSFQFQAYKSRDCYVSRFHTWLLGQFWDNDVGTLSSVSLLFRCVFDDDVRIYESAADR